MLIITRPSLPDHTELDLAPEQVQVGDVVQFLVRGMGGGTRQGGRVVRTSRVTYHGKPSVRFEFEAEGDRYTASLGSTLRVERPQHEGALSAKRTVIVTEA